MKRLILLVASILSWLSALVCLISAFGVFSEGEILKAVYVLTGVPMSLALAIVFGYVSEQLEKEETEKLKDEREQLTTERARSGGGDVAGTPWERDSNHTLD